MQARRAGIDDPAEAISVAHRHFVRLAWEEPEWARLLVRLDVPYRVTDDVLGRPAMRDLRAGIAAGRFQVADPRLALRASGGALIAVMHAVLLGELGKRADCEHAEGVLRSFGARPRRGRRDRTQADARRNRPRGAHAMTDRRPARTGSTCTPTTCAPAYKEALQEAEMWLIGGIPVPEWTPELALEFMDAHGIAVQMLSVSDPGVEFVAPERAPALARECNDYAAGVVHEHPGRFGAFAVLSMSDVEQARAETVRALDDLHLDGVGLLSSYGGRYPGDPAFEPLLSELNERRAWVMVHPASIAAELKPDLSVPGFIAEYPFDTTRAFVSLLFNGAFERYPHIRWHFAHGGGTLPMLRARLAAASAAAKEFGPLLGMPAGSALLSARERTQSARVPPSTTRR